MNHNYKLVWLSDELEGYECLRCGYETVDPDDKFPCTYWEKNYEGFESLYDLEEDILYALEHEINFPAEFLGTLKVTMEYIE